jgi:hypothetical protein
MPSTVAISALPGQIVAGNMLRVVPKTSDYTLVGDAAASDCGKLFTNTGASGQVIFSLPASAVGLNYSFCVTAAQYLQVKAAGSDVIYLGTGVTSAAGYLRGASIGTAFKVSCPKSGFWFVECYSNSGADLELDGAEALWASGQVGLRVTPVAGDPGGTPAIGTIWYNSSTNKLKVRTNSASVELN